MAITPYTQEEDKTLQDNKSKKSNEVIDANAFEEALRAIAGDETAISFEAGPRRDIGPRLS